MSRRQSSNPQKASYKQGINTRGSKPRSSQVPKRRLSTRGSILPNSEGKADPYADDALDIAPRAPYRPPPGHETQSINFILQYLTRTRLEENFSQLLHLLLNRNNLPYNPYTGLATRLRPYVEKFYQDAHSPEEIEFVLGTPLQETPVLNLYTPKENPVVWGLSSVLRTVNPTVLQRYKWLTDDVTPNPDNLFQSEDYSSQVMVALVGPTIFHGTFYKTSHHVQVRLEYLVAGPESTEGVSIFINSVMLDIDALYNNPYHRILGVNLPVQVGDKDDTWQLEFWDPERVQDEKADFLQLMSDAVIGNKFIYVECIFKLDPTMSHFVRGQKQYGLNFIEVVDEIREEGLMCFSEFPMASLHEGVFLSQSHAESYITIFSPQLDSVDIQNTKIESARPGSKGTRRTGQAPHQETDRYSIHIHVHGRLEHFRPKKVRIDGFRLGEDPGFGPFAWQILTPFKAHLQRNIAGNQQEAELFETIFDTIILVLTERTDRVSYGENILSEIYRILHGTAGQLFMLMEHNKEVRALVRGFANSDDIHFVRQLLAQYKRDIDEMLSDSLKERTGDLATAGKAMSGQVEKLLSSDDFEFGSASHLQQVIETFRNIDNYCMTLLLQAVEDAMPWSPQLKKLIEKMKTTFPEEIKRPTTRLRKSQAKKNQTVVRPSRSEFIYSHGREEEQIMKHENMVVNVSLCCDRDSAPKIISKDSVLLKYVTDTHLDEFWQDFQIELFTGQNMPPNPHARLITRCREATMRMDLFYEKSSTLIGRLLSGEPQTADSDNYVYQLAGCDGYGAKSSLSVLDVGGYVPVAQIIQQNFAAKNYIHRKGPFRIGVCMGMVGQCLLYGKMQPYLNEVILQEHYYIQGPEGCEREALGLFSKMVYGHVVDLIQLNTYPVVGVYMGEDNVRWTWEDVLNNRQGFLTEFEMVCARRETIYMKSYVLLDEWRYVAVKKFFQLHWLTDDHIGKELYYPDEPASFYQCLFFTKDRASFHYQNGGPRSGNPLSGPNVRLTFQWLDQQILKARDTAQWLEVHRMLLLRSLMMQDDKHVVETWRMLHSIGAQAEYVCHLIEGLQDLTIFAMEYTKWLDLDSPQDTARKTGKTPGTFRTVPTERRHPLDMKTLSRMTSAVQQKILYVCDARTAMLPPSMLEFVEMKVKSVLERDQVTGDLYPALEDQTVTCLEEVKQMMRAVQDMLAGDVHNVSPNAQAAIKAIEEDMNARPTSVASERLDDPDQYKRRPRATKMILDDELLYRP